MGARDRVLFHPEAIAEARAAYVWYAQRSDKAAEAFLGELDATVARIFESPGTWPAYVGPTRRCLFERFPFFVVYRERGERIEIVAVAHAKRRPGYWKSR